MPHRNRVARLAFGACLPVALLTSACAAEPNGYTGKKVETIYADLCAVCHGDKLEGGLGLSLIDGEWKNGDSDSAILKAITEGNVDMGMQPFKDTLTADQQRAMVIYIRENEAAAARERNPPPAPNPAAVTHTKHHDYRTETVIKDGLRTPWSMAFLPGGGALVTEFDGPLRLVQPDWTLKPKPVADTPPSVRLGQGGRLAVVLHPGYATNGWVYLAFSDGESGPGRGRAITAVARGRIEHDRWINNEWIYRADPKFQTGAGQHFGSDIVFRDGYVWFVVGERGGGMEAQDLKRPNGKIFRLFDDGRVPPDNPFVNTPDAIPGIWSYGHRNPQGMALDSRDGAIYATEHGPRGGDELNLILPGRNYGWPVITYGMNYDGTPITDHTAQDGMEQPLLHWTPSIAPCGLTMYTGSRFPRWSHDLFAGSLRAQEVHRVRVRDGKVVERELVLKGMGRIRDVVDGPDGCLYLVLNDPDRIVRLSPAE